MIDDLHASETLADDELATITGYKKPASQRMWLDRNGWKYVQNRAGHPIVGRAYARLKLAGINPNKLTTPDVWSLDLSKVS